MVFMHDVILLLSAFLVFCFVFLLFSLFALLQSEDKTVLFAVGSTLVNCTNSYDVEKPDPQMVELAKYAKQHVPEDHPKVMRLNLSLALRKRPFPTSFASTCLSFIDTGCTFLRGEETEKSAGCRSGISFSVHGQTGESCPHRSL